MQVIYRLDLRKSAGVNFSDQVCRCNSNQTTNNHKSELNVWLCSKKKVVSSTQKNNARGKRTALTNGAMVFEDCVMAFGNHAKACVDCVRACVDCVRACVGCVRACEGCVRACGGRARTCGWYVALRSGGRFESSSFYNFSLTHSTHTLEI